MDRPERPERVIVLYNTDYGAGSGAPGDAAPGDAAPADAAAVEPAARAICAALAATGYTAELVGLHGTDALEVLAELRRRRPDLVFNLCESMAGDARNEPTLAGLLDLYGVPYTGTDLLGLASCLHKQRTKEILAARSVATPPYRYLPDPDALGEPALDALDYPWFVKLVHEDASIGITEQNVVRSGAALRARAAELMREHRQGVLAERFVEGREVNVTLLGNGRAPRVLPLHEIDFSAMPGERPRIVSYAAKWDEAHVDYAGTPVVPLQGATPALIAAIEATARAAWAALGLRDYGRVDLRIDAAGVPWVIDVNPNCDLSPDAGVARAAAAAGLSHAALIDEIARTAWRRIRSQIRD